MKKYRKIIITLALALLLVLSGVGLTRYIKEERRKAAEEEAARLAREEAERKAAEEEAARIAAEEARKAAEEDRRTRNPLTGLKMKETAIGKRPAAVMVENSPDARPQWGMDDPSYSPDIILEAEVEAGITRTMWLFSDFTSLPEIVGPIRSARPPFVHFSELFDAIYVHWGQSDSAGSYLGASDVIARDGVNNINQMAYYGKTALFDRNHERDVALEHTGILYGAKLPEAIDDYGYRIEMDRDVYSFPEFNDELLPVSDVRCDDIDVTISYRSWTKHWTYSKADQYYHTDDFRNDLTRRIILVLFDTTEYITKPGANFSYCNYLFAGGEGKLASLGTVADIRWEIEKGKLVIRDLNGDVVSFNRGKTWIGWISSNYGGSVEINRPASGTDQ